MKTRILKFLASIVVLALASCSGIMAGITGQKPAAVAVQRAGQPQAPIIQVAANDLAQAEAGDPDDIHGLYNTGQVAELVAQAVDVSGK